MSPETEKAPNRSADWRHSKWLALLEFALVALIFWLDYSRWHHLIKISKTVYLVALGWISLRVRGLGWKDVGMKLYRSWGRTIAIGVACGAAIEALDLIVIQPLLVHLTHHWPDLSDFRGLRGNFKLLPLALLLTWTLAAFGEEMVYRGYLMNRVADVFGRNRRAWVLSLIVVNVVFGFSHTYQGITGVLENIIDGLLLAWIYLRFDHRLSVPIVAHGLIDSIDFLLIVFGKYPGM